MTEEAIAAARRILVGGLNPWYQRTASEISDAIARLDEYEDWLQARRDDGTLTDAEYGDMCAIGPFIGLMTTRRNFAYDEEEGPEGDDEEGDE